MKTTDVLKAVEGDIIFGNHQSHNIRQNHNHHHHHNHHHLSPAALIRSNLTDYSNKTLTNSQSELNTTTGQQSQLNQPNHRNHRGITLVKSRSHSTTHHLGEAGGNRERTTPSDINSTFIAGSLASAFVSSRKLSLSVDSMAGNEDLRNRNSSRLHDSYQETSR
jgi:hypothetical protein